MKSTPRASSRATLSRDRTTTISATGNEHASYRDLFYRLNRAANRPDASYFKIYEPPPEEEADGVSRVVVHLYPAVGQALSKHSKQTFGEFCKRLGSPHLSPGRVEIEFSAPLNAVARPNDFRKSVIDWALDVCPAVLLCVDWERGDREAHKILGSLQVTFRSSLEHAEEWEAFLRQRLKARHQFEVVHGVAGSA
jgi:hypothetical protein